MGILSGYGSQFYTPDANLWSNKGRECKCALCQSQQANRRPVTLPWKFNQYPNSSHNAPAGPAIAAGRTWQPNAPSAATIEIRSTGTAGDHSNGIMAVGGRQVLRAQNRALDLRYHFNNYWHLNGQRSAFSPASNGGSFGFLFWYDDQELIGRDVICHAHVDGGAQRADVHGTGAAYDPRDPDSYSQFTPPYFRYESGTATYYYYEQIATNPRYGTTVVDRVGNVIYYHYTSGKLRTIYGDMGQLIPYFGYNSSSNIDRMFLQDQSGADHRTTYYGYLSSLKRIAEPEGVVTYFNTNGSSISSEVDPDGHATYFQYDNIYTTSAEWVYWEGRATYFTFGSGINKAWNREANSSRVAVNSLQMWEGNTQMYSTAVGGSLFEYDINKIAPDNVGLVLADISPNGARKEYAYNSLKLFSRVKDYNGGSTYFYYDSNDLDLTEEIGKRHGQLYQATYYRYYSGNRGLKSIVALPNGGASYFGYDGRNRLSRVVDPRGGSTYFGYDAYGNRVQILDALGGSAYFAYNANAYTSRAVDDRGSASYYRYDQLDQLRVSLDPAGASTYFEYNKRGLPLVTCRAETRIVYYAYDSFKNRTRVARSLNSNLVTTYYEYDGDDNLIATTDANLQRTTNGYDSSERIVRASDPLGNTQYYIYDPASNLMQSRDANGTYQRSGFDNLGNEVVRVRGLTQVPAPTLSGLRAHWNLNETSGNRLDNSGNNVTLYDKNGVGSTTGIFDKAASFDSAAKTYFHVASNNSNQLAVDSISIALWAKSNINLTGSSGGRTLAAKYWGVSAQGWKVFLSRSTPDYYRVEFTASGHGTWYATINADETQWHHYAITYDSATGTGKVYFDGQLLFSQTQTSGSINSTTAYFTMGCDFDGSVTTAQHLWDGAIDECYVYDTVLTQKEISILAQQRVAATFGTESTDFIATYYAYDLDSNRTISMDGRGNSTYYAYDALNDLVQMRDAAGNAAYYQYDFNRNTVATLDPRSNATYFGYDLLNRNTIRLDALLRASYYRYDSVSNRVAELTPGLQAAYWAYDALSRVVASRDYGGFGTYFGYDLAGNQDRMLNPRGYATYFAFDQLDRQTAVLDATLTPTYYGYDGVGNLLRVQNHYAGATSAVTYFGYDAVNRLAAQQDALNRITYYGYDGNGNRLRVNPPGTPARATYYQYDKFDRMVATSGSSVGASYFAYDAETNVVASLDSRLSATYFAYDALNRTTIVLDAMAGASYFGYDANSNLTKQRDPRGFATYFDYDVLDRLVRTTDAKLNSTTRGYTAAGNLGVVLPPVGAATYFNYESRNLVSAVLDASANSTYFAYDANGNRITALSPRGYGSYFNYDTLDRLNQTLDAEGGFAYFAYDVGSNVSIVEDALQRSSYFAYDALDRVTTVMNALPAAVYFGYDLAGNRDREMDALLRATYYGYDTANRLTAILDPLGRGAYYAYDNASNLTQTLDNNAIAAYFAYDRLNRRTQILYLTAGYGTQPYGISPYGGNAPQYFAYDATSNLVATSDAWGSSYFGYDSLSRLEGRSTPRGDSVYYAYDAASDLVKLQYPQDGATAYYGYDDGLRLIKLRTPTATSKGVYYEYDASSNVTKKTLGNEMVSWASFDKAERIAELKYNTANGDGVAYFIYGRNAAGQILRIEREGDLAIYYSYDNIDRLVEENWRRKSTNAQIYAFTYQYDNANNRLAMRRETTAGTEFESAYYSYADDNSLTKRRVQNSGIDTYFYYDRNGALTEYVEGSNTTYFTYHPNQLITRIKPPVADGQPWNFEYDSRLNRYKVDRAGTVRYLLWDGLNCMEERNNDGTLYARYTYGYSRIYGIGSCVEIYVSGTNKNYTLALDHRGTAHVLLDENGTETGRRYYDAFGVILGQSGTWPIDLGYQTNWQTIQIGSKWWGLSRYRLYDPATGTFPSRDFLPFPNKYRAFSNNGVGQVDRDGLSDVNPAPVSPWDPIPTIRPTTPQVLNVSSHQGIKDWLKQYYPDSAIQQQILEAARKYEELYFKSINNCSCRAERDVVARNQLGELTPDEVRLVRMFAGVRRAAIWNLQQWALKKAYDTARFNAPPSDPAARQWAAFGGTSTYVANLNRGLIAGVLAPQVVGGIGIGTSGSNILADLATGNPVSTADALTLVASGLTAVAPNPLARWYRGTLTGISPLDQYQLRGSFLSSPRTPGGEIPLFRSMSKEELLDIICRGEFRMHPRGRSLEAKEFATSLQDAYRFKAITGNEVIVQYWTPQSTSSLMEQLILDQMPARVVQPGNLPAFSQGFQYNTQINLRLTYPGD